MSDGSSFPKVFVKAPMGRFFLGAYEKLKLKDGKDVEIYENLNFVYFDGHGPRNPTHSKMSPVGLLKSLSVETSGMLPMRFFARNSDMILVLTVGFCRVSTIVPLNEQGMVMEGERI